MDLKWRKYRSYSGPVVNGTWEIEKPITRNHVDRAYWLTTMVESGGKLGAVMMADGTAVTIGLDQHVAVMPKLVDTTEQGGAWKLLRRLEITEGPEDFKSAIQALWEELRDVGWYIAQDGSLRFADHYVDTLPEDGRVFCPGDLVPGRIVREWLTPPMGVVPESGPFWESSARFAKLFHDVTSHPASERAQVEFGKEHLVERTGRYGFILDRAYLDRNVSAVKVDQGGWTPALDLALCMYQSHMVNAPGIAKKQIEGLWRVWSPVTEPDDEFAKKLIFSLGNCSYGRWDDDIKHGRYQRTRSIAADSGLWPDGLFDGPDAIMPKDLPG